MTDEPARRAVRAAQMREWRAKNPERWRSIVAPARKRWRERNADRNREIKRAHRQSVRREILDLLGGQRCVRCGYDADWRALQIDHIHSDGRLDKAHVSKGASNMWAFRNKLLDKETREAARRRYQVLCCNCNRIKMYERAEFPQQMAPIDPSQRVRRRRADARRPYSAPL